MVAVLPLPFSLNGLRLEPWLVAVTLERAASSGAKNGLRVCKSFGDGEATGAVCVMRF